MKHVIGGVAAIGMVAGMQYCDAYKDVREFEVRRVQVDPSYDVQPRMMTVGNCGDERFDQIAEFLVVEHSAVCGSHTHPWARDHFIDIGDRIMVPHSTMFRPFPENMLRAGTLYDVMEQAGVDAVGAPFWFEGGQVLATDEHVLLPEIFMDDYHTPFADEQRVFDNILYIPNTVDGQMMMSGHLDMYVTPLNSDTMLVANVVELSQQDLDRLSETYGPVTNLLDDRYQDVFDATARMLSEHYTVERVPMGIISNGDTLYVGYNNTIVSGDKLVVPSYGITLDDVVANQLKDYNVLHIDSRDWVQNNSGPHCQVNLY